MVIKGNTISVAIYLPGQDDNADHPNEHGLARIIKDGSFFRRLECRRQLRAGKGKCPLILPYAFVSGFLLSLYIT